MEVSEQTKICKKCGEEKSVSEFSPDKRLKNGVQIYCKPCQASNTREYRKNNPEKAKETWTKSRLKMKTENPEEFKRRKKISDTKYKQNDNHKKLINNHKTKWRKNNPEKVKSIGLLRNHGITLEQYKIMEKDQNFKCAICEKPLEHVRFKYFCVDHNHTTGKIRGLLCNDCNVGIGFLKVDSLETKLLFNAINYIEKSIKKEVLNVL